MPRYLIRYIDNDGDYSKCWEDAKNEEEAKELALDEYWDIKEIKYVEKI